MPRPRRTSSGLGAELRGDTSASAFSTLEPMSPIVSPPLTPRTSQSKHTNPRSKRRKARSLLRRWRDLSFRHTWVNPLALIIILISLYLINPTPSNPLNSAIFLSYKLSPHDHLIPPHARYDPTSPTYYGKGLRDLVFVAFYSVVLSFTREFLMQLALRPLALHWGIRSQRKQNRFMEQAYTAVYFSVLGPLGMYVMSRTPVWYFNTTGMFEDFPHRSHEAIFKAYYLLQASYWAQQAIVLILQLEKPRKDFKELVGHHIITLALIGLSYKFHFTYMGLAVYITHDVSDLFLATSKSLNYIESPLVSPWFMLFMVIWIYLRHYLNLSILYAVLTKFATVGPFILRWDTQQYKCWISQWITFSLLGCLQAINLFWLFFILRIAYNITVRHETADDVRSDEEGEEETGKDGNREDDEGTVRGNTKVEEEGLKIDAAKRIQATSTEKKRLLNGTTGHESGIRPRMNGSAQKGQNGSALRGTRD